MATLSPWIAVRRLVSAGRSLGGTSPSPGGVGATCLAHPAGRPPAKHTATNPAHLIRALGSIIRGHCSFDARPLRRLRLGVRRRYCESVESAVVPAPPGGAGTQPVLVAPPPAAK